MRNVDVIVLGSGAAGLTAALAASGHGASVLLLEKSDKIGGTSAWSGGMVWIPNNPYMAEAGIADSREEALLYLNSLSHDMIDPALAEAFVDTGPEMVRWLEANTPVQFALLAEFPDYHPEHPGGKPGGGRSLECKLFSYDTLGEAKDNITIGYDFGTAPITMEESPLGRAIPRKVPRQEMARRAGKDERGCGQALIGRLYKGCLDAEVEIITETRALELIVEDGKVAGVMAEGRTGKEQYRATGGVVLATGGFEWNKELVRTFLRGPMTSPVSVPTNEGDGLTMCMRIGAALGNMREAWWMPAIESPGDRGDGRNPTHLFAGGRALPRSIMVNRAGQRFTNEAANYNAFGAAFHEQDVSSFDYVNLPCWFIFDQKHLEKYGFIDTPPGAPAANWVVSEPTLEGLAANLGIDSRGLNSTVDRWNTMVVQGRDADFRRGESVHDTWWGDPELKGKPEATLGPLDEGPFYAVEVKSGSLGTKGGPKTDELARVQDVDGKTIPGLYAAGNVMASAMGMTYGGAGGTLAPGMVFGFIAGIDAARRSA